MGDAMRGAHFRLSPAQKQRMLVAQERCRDAAGSVHSSAFVNVGDTIPVDYENGYLRGHGTQVVDGQLLATVCGVVERVNKLVSVRPLRARYNPETGDVVVGRVTEVAPKRWKVDVNSRQDAQLMLSAVNLPGGIQRRRTATDELNMRDLFTENDLISAEVQTLHQDGSLHLHTRSLKYGKLESGQLVKVAPYLIKRLKQHFHQLKQYGVQMILGCNGYVWISALPQSTPDIATDQKRANTESLEAAAGTADSQNVEISRELRERICRLANVVRVLGACGFLIHPDSIVDTYEASLSWGTELKHMFSGEFFVKVVEREAEQRSKKGRVMKPRRCEGEGDFSHLGTLKSVMDTHSGTYVLISIQSSSQMMVRIPFYVNLMRPHILRPKKSRTNLKRVAKSICRVFCCARSGWRRCLNSSSSLWASIEAIYLKDMCGWLEGRVASDCADGVDDRWIFAAADRQLFPLFAPAAP